MRVLMNKSTSRNIIGFVYLLLQAQTQQKPFTISITMKINKPLGRTYATVEQPEKILCIQFSSKAFRRTSPQTYKSLRTQLYNFTIIDVFSAV